MKSDRRPFLDDHVWRRCVDGALLLDVEPHMIWIYSNVYNGHTVHYRNYITTDRIGSFTDSLRKKLRYATKGFVRPCMVIRVSSLLQPLLQLADVQGRQNHTKAGQA